MNGTQMTGDDRPLNMVLLAVATVATVDKQGQSAESPAWQKLGERRRNDGL
jgi:hypothetical protein